MPEVFESDSDLETVDAGVRSEYREKLKRALIASGSFDGSSRSFEELIRVLSDFEGWLNEVFGGGEVRLNDDQEVELYRKYYGRRGRITIGNMLDVADHNFKRRLKKSVGEGKSGEGEKSGVLTVDLPGVLLPPGEIAMHGRGERMEKKEARFDERLRQLVGLLVKNGVYTEDMLILRGKLEPTMMRRVTYHLVEIPKLDKQILVCDQVGEATFVIDGFLGRDSLMSLNKEELQERFPARIRKVVYRESAQWEGDIMKLLFEGLNVGDCASVNVRERESLRQYIRDKYTAEQWGGMKQREKRKFEILGMKLNAIARKFGVKGNPISYHDIHKLLGQKIYGAEHECLRVEEKAEYSAEEIKEAILAEVPNAEEWVGMQWKEKKEFEIMRMKLNAIAGKFEVKGNPVSSSVVYKLLGQKIYGAEHECLRVEEKADYSAEEIKKAILAEVPNAEEWVGMKVKEKAKFEIMGMKLYVIAGRFEVKGDPISYHDIHKLLGQKIYGAEHECLRVEEKVEYSAEEIREAILERVPTAEKWAIIKKDGRREFDVLGMKLKAIASRFEVKGDPISYHDIHKLLGQKIYGAEHECLRVEEKVEYSAEEIKEAILERVPTAEEWAGMKPSEKAKFEILGMKLCAIARKFGVKGNPISYHDIRKLLGQKIYGAEHECLRVEEKAEYSAEEIKEAILAEVPTAEEWVVMNQKEKGKFKILGMKLKAIARKIGVKGDPINYHDIHKLLGQKIYGAEHECLRVEEKVEYSAEEIREAILERVPTAEEWAGMKPSEKAKFEILGMKLCAIARKFGVEGNPVSSSVVYKLLGQKIYGAEHECLWAERVG